MRSTFFLHFPTLLHRFLVLALLFPFSGIRAQAQGQTIRGRITDAVTGQPLPGATVRLLELPASGALSDAGGYYRIPGIAPGRYTLRFSYLGYEAKTAADIIVGSGREYILDISLEEKAEQISEVEVSTEEKDGLNNEMTSVSSLSFNVEQTEKFAGTRGDPARMVSAFAGVQGSDDSRNDIVIRGNSPFGVLYRLEGIDIPNPNHFAIAGTSGGPVSMLNNKVLGNSDFFTGAFPAEYGNTVSGVLDLRLRNGNNEKHEFTGQLGFLGTEITAEGPLSDKGASYLLNYRYSTLRLFEFMKVRIGTDAVPAYQDAAFKINLPIGKGSVSLFGMGGQSSINILVSELSEPHDEIYGDKDRDQYFSSSMGLVGVTHSSPYGKRSSGRLTLATSGTAVDAHHNKVYFNSQFLVDSLKPVLGYDLRENKQTLAWSLLHKANTRHSYKTGFLLDRPGVNMTDSVLDNSTGDFVTRLDARHHTLLARVYGMWKWKLSNRLTMNNGMHLLYWDLNKDFLAEPRLVLCTSIPRAQRSGLLMASTASCNRCICIITRCLPEVSGRSGKTTASGSQEATTLCSLPPGYFPASCG